MLISATESRLRKLNLPSSSGTAMVRIFGVGIWKGGVSGGREQYRTKYCFTSIIRCWGNCGGKEQSGTLLLLHINLNLWDGFDNKGFRMM